MYWDQVLQQVMDISGGELPYLDQMVSQTVAKQPSDIPPWSWPDVLNLSMMTWTIKMGDKELKEAVEYARRCGSCEWTRKYGLA